MKLQSLYQLILKKILKRKLKGKYSFRYMSHGSQPTLLEELEKEYSLLSSKAEQALNRRENIHSYLGSDIQKVKSLTAIFKDMDLQESPGGQGEDSIIINDKKNLHSSDPYPAHLDNLRQKIEKKVINKELVGKPHKYLYVSKNSPSISNGSWLNQLTFSPFLRTSGAVFAGVALVVGLIFYPPNKEIQQEQLSFLEAVQVYGSFTKNKTSLKAASLNHLSDKEKQKFLYLNPGDELETGPNSLARIALNDKTMIQFGPSTRLKMGLNHNEKSLNTDDEIFSKEFILKQGIVHFIIPKQKKNSSYMVLGKNFSVQIQGTRFVLAQGKDYSRLILEKGKLQVTLFSQDSRKKKGKRESIIIDKPTMIEILSNAKKETQMLKSPIPKQYISYLGVFSRLDKDYSSLLVHPQINKEEISKQILNIGSLGSYNPRATIGELERLQEFTTNLEKFSKKGKSYNNYRNNDIKVYKKITTGVGSRKENGGKPSYYFEILDKGIIKKNISNK